MGLDDNRQTEESPGGGQPLRQPRPTTRRARRVVGADHLTDERIRAEGKPRAPTVPTPPSPAVSRRWRSARLARQIAVIRQRVPAIGLLQWPPSGQMIVRFVIAAMMVAAAVFINPSFLGWGLFATLAVLVVPVGLARSFVLAFIPYATVWFVFTFLRSLADETALADTLNLYVVRFERWLFGGQLPTISLQDRFYVRGELAWYDYFLTGIHWSYFVVPHALAFYLWRTRPDLFRRFFWAMTLLLGVGLMIYFLLPSNPPWVSGEPYDSPATATVDRIMKPVGEHLGGGFYNASYKVVGESNPIAAMPSIHLAITALLMFPAGHFGRRWRLLAIIYTGLMGLALVYLGEHYVIDVVVGALIAAYGWFAAGAWLARIGPLVAGRFSPVASPAPASPGFNPARLGR